MAKDGERNYVQNIGEEDFQYTLNKPFSVENCPKLLADIGAVMSLLPSPPARLLDLGCGAGWTSSFLSQFGYSVVGIDISEDMIKYAKKNKKEKKIKDLEFLVCDYEEGKFNNEFDCAVFFDSLHHAEDEQAAVQMVYTALKQDGICVVVEPGKGSSKLPEAIEAVKKFGVTEKDMPPKLVKKLAKKSGFRKIKVYPRLNHFIKALYLDLNDIQRLGFLGKYLNLSIIRYMMANFIMFFYKSSEGITVIKK